MAIKRKYYRSVSVDYNKIWWALFIIAGFLIISFTLGLYTGYKLGLEKSENVEVRKINPVSTGSIIPEQGELTKENSPAPSEIIDKSTLKALEQNNEDENIKKIIETQTPAPKKTKKPVRTKNNIYLGLTEKELQKGKSYYTIQATSTRNEKAAKEYYKALREKGYPSYMETASLSSGIWYRIRIGNFQTRDEATEIGKELASKGVINSDFWISKVGEK